MEIGDWRLEIRDWGLADVPMFHRTSVDVPSVDVPSVDVPSAVGDEKHYSANLQSRIVRAATPADIASILRLVNEHARRGELLPRTAVSIRDTLPDWLVGEDKEGRIVACVSLLFYTPTLAEVRSLAVDDRCKGQGWGSAIMAALIVEAKRRGVPTLFALTRAVRFFERAGFTVTDKEMFPEKVWRDCHICPIRHRCDETAVVLQT